MFPAGARGVTTVQQIDLLCEAATVPVAACQLAMHVCAADTVRCPRWSVSRCARSAVSNSSGIVRIR